MTMIRRLTILMFVALIATAVPLLAQQAGQSKESKSPDPKWIVGEPAETPLTGDALEEKTAEVAALLRCPVCQGLSIYDSPATMARNMLAQTRDLVAQGYSEEQILQYFEKAYGEFVRLEPPMRGVNWLVWLSPLVFLLVGVVLIRVMLGRKAKEDGGGGSPERLPSRDELPDDRELASYVLRVRELAYGWPAGVNPESSEGDAS